MIELYDPDVDALGYVSTKKMTGAVRVKINLAKKRAKTISSIPFIISEWTGYF